MHDCSLNDLRDPKSRAQQSGKSRSVDSAPRLNAEEYPAERHSTNFLCNEIDKLWRFQVTQVVVTVEIDLSKRSVRLQRW